MRRSHWTLLQWNSLECKFVPKIPGGGGFPLLNTRRRIPQIDKLLANPIDKRLKEFGKLIRNQRYGAGKLLLDNWVDYLDINTLEECSMLLASAQFIGPKAEKKLRDYCLWDGLFEYRYPQPNSREFAGGPLQALQDLDLPNPEMQELLTKTVSLSPELKTLSDVWFQQITSSDLMLDQWLEILSPAKNESSNLTVILKYLNMHSQARIVTEFMAKFTASSTSVTFPRSLSYMCRQLGNVIESALLSNVARSMNMPHFNAKSKLLWNMLGQSPWNSKQKIILGAFWINCALRNCRFSVLYNGRMLSRPAFWNTWYMSGTHKRGILVVNHGLVEQLKENMRSNDPSLFVTSNQIPSLVPLRPWTSTRPSSRLLYDCGLRLVTSQSTEGQATVNEAIKNRSARPQLAGLNRLQGQSWRINQVVLSVLKATSPFKEVETKPITMPQGSGSYAATTINSGKKEKARLERAKKISRTQWSQALAIAEALGSREFYLPMYMDFRGRCYPMASSNLSFMGNDCFRSLFLFGEKKPLGTQGLRWLKIHLANLYGECKLESFTDRQKWVDAHRTDIIECSHAPLVNKWWQRAAKPYQVLAACIDLAAAWSSDSPELYESSLPVQLDGTSNGLQHLVALSRDDGKAEAVNLKGANRGDVYALVANTISKYHVDLNIDRKLVKKAVMVYFYGGSPVRIAESLEELGVRKARLLSKTIMSSLETMFESERKVQKWLGECAKRLMSATRADHITSPDSADSGLNLFGTPTLVWTTPLGFPVVQPYVSTKLMAIRTPLQAFYWPSPFHLPTSDKPKQVAGVVANFVHSLDAAHMLATAQNMPSGTSFAAVHDSFWTHAGTIPQLNQISREQFVNIHQQNLLQLVWKEWNTRYEGYMCLATVYQDSPLYNSVKSSRGKSTDLKAELVELYNAAAIIDERATNSDTNTNGMLRNHERVSSTNVAATNTDNRANVTSKDTAEIPTNDTASIPTEVTNIKATTTNTNTLASEEFPVIWGESGPYIGTPGNPSLKLWVPLEFPAPPELGTFDISEVKKATYFFS